MSKQWGRMAFRIPFRQKDDMELETTIYTNIYKDTTSRGPIQLQSLWHMY